MWPTSVTANSRFVMNGRSIHDLATLLPRWTFPALGLMFTIDTPIDLVIAALAQDTRLVWSHISRLFRLGCAFSPGLRVEIRTIILGFGEIEIYAIPGALILKQMLTTNFIHSMNFLQIDILHDMSCSLTFDI